MERDLEVREAKDIGKSGTNYINNIIFMRRGCKIRAFTAVPFIFVDLLQLQNIRHLVRGTRLPFYREARAAVTVCQSTKRRCHLVSKYQKLIEKFDTVSLVQDVCIWLQRQIPQVYISDLTINSQAGEHTRRS